MVGKGYGRLAVLTALYCLLCCWLLVCTCDGQAAQQQPAGERATELADAVAKVKSGQFNGYHVGVIGEARAIEAIPDLEKQFTLISDPIQKAQIARVLLLLGDKKDAYWNYLAEMVKPAVESDAPGRHRSLRDPAVIEETVSGEVRGSRGIRYQLARRSGAIERNQPDVRFVLLE